MDMKDVYAALEKLDNGADLITTIKGEINTLNNEAKKNRIAGEHTAEKLKNVLAGLNLEDADDVADKAKNLKAALDTFAQGGKKPTEVAKQITDLTAQVNKVTKQLDAMTKTAQEEKTKRLDGMKMAKAVELLSKGHAASPENMAKLLEGNIIVKDDESLAYNGKDGEISLEDGVADWLKENSWAVKANGGGGSGSPNGGNGGGSSDPFLAGFNS
nr:MAG TPA: minor structural protein [Caudoviricetes sp.]